MILTVHILLGAAIVSKIGFLPLALALALLSHYLLDFLPHLDYSIENIKEKQWSRAFLDFSKIVLDIMVGFFIVFILSKNFVLSLSGGLIAILPDAITLLSIISPNKLFKALNEFHQKIHYRDKNEKISSFWEISAPILVILLSILWLPH